MRHRIFNIIMAASLLLYIGSAVAWYYSYSRAFRLMHYTIHGGTPDVVELVPENGVLYLHSRRTISISIFPLPPVTSTGWDFGVPKQTFRDEWDIDFTGAPSRWGGTVRAGKAGPTEWYTREALTHYDRYRDLTWVVGVPNWLVTAVFGLLPALWLTTRAIRRIRTRPGHCKSCGYDLRASTDRCPECGAPLAGLERPTLSPRQP